MASVLSQGRSRSRMISSFSARSPQHWRPSPPRQRRPNVPLPPPPHITQSLKLSQEPVSLHPPPTPAILPSLAPLFPSPPTPHPPISLCSPKCIPAWQTTWDFTSPLKSAASGNHSSPCNILVFKGIRDWGGNQCCYIPPVSSWLLFQLMLCGRESERERERERERRENRFLSGDLNWSLIFPFFCCSNTVGTYFPVSGDSSTSNIHRRDVFLLKSFFSFFILTHKSITTTIYKFLVIFKTKTHLHMQQ